MSIMQSLSQGRELGNDARFFLKENRQALWAILKPYIPILIVLFMVSAYMGSHINQTSNRYAFQTGDANVVYYTIQQSANANGKKATSFSDIATQRYNAGPRLMPGIASKLVLGVNNIILGYIMFVLSISWFRYCINGPDHFIAMNALKPTWQELKTIFVFIGLVMAVSILAVVAIAILSRLTAPIIGISFGAILAFYFLIRLNFYVPIRALQHHVTLGQSFYLTEGYVIKMVSGSFIANFRLLLLVILFVFVTALFLGLLITMGSGGGVVAFFQFVLVLPLYLYFLPLMYALNMHVVSHCYLDSIKGVKLPDDTIHKDRRKTKHVKKSIIEKDRDKEKDTIRDEDYFY